MKQGLMGKYFQSVGLILTVVAFSTAGYTKDISKEDSQNWKKIFNFDESTSDEPVTLQIGNYDYKVPMNYLMGTVNASCNHEAVGFVAVYPDFIGKTKETVGTIFRTTGPDNPTLDILLSAHRERVEKRDEYLKNRLNILKKNFGPHAEMRTKNFGLNVIKADVSKNTFSRDIFYNDENGKLARVISCTPLGTVVNPGCEHSFILNDAVIKVAYRVRFLPDWQDIEAKTRAFFSNATIGQAERLKPYCK